MDKWEFIKNIAYYAHQDRYTTIQLEENVLLINMPLTTAPLVLHVEKHEKS